MTTCSIPVNFTKYSFEILNRLNEDRKFSRSLCDFIINVNGKAFHAHKCVLAMFSDNLKNAIVLSMQEGKDSYNLESSNSESMETILNFIYTGKITIDEKNVNDLINATKEGLMEIPFIKEATDIFNEDFGGIDDPHSKLSRSDHCTEILQRLDVDRMREKQFCDFSIITSSIKIPIHRCVLSCVIDNAQELFKNLNEDIVTQLVQFIYTGSSKFSTDDIFSVLHCIDLFKIQCCADNSLSFLLKKENHADFFHVFLQARRLQLNSVCATMRSHFCHACQPLIQCSEFFQLPLESVKYLLDEEGDRHKQRTDLINGREVMMALEANLFNSVLCWVKHDPTQRKEQLPSLISCIRVEKLSQECLRRLIFNEDLVLNCPKTLTALCHLLLPFVPVKAPHHILLLFHDHYRHTAVNKYNVSKKTMLVMPKYLSKCYDCRKCTTAVLLNKTAYLIGGGERRSSDNVSSLCLDKDSNGVWNKCPSLLEGRIAPSAALFSGHIIVCGGKSLLNQDEAENVSKTLDSCEKYEPLKDSVWSLIANMKEERAYHSVVVLGNYLYAIGGCGTSVLKSVECYDTNSGCWKHVASMNSARDGLAAVVLDNKIYAIGGKNESGEFLSSVEKYHSETNTWSMVTHLLEARQGHVACALLGKIFVIGGVNTNGNVLFVELYNKEKNKWEAFDQLVEPCVFGSCLGL